MFRRLMVAGLALGAVLISLPAQAAGNCAQRDTVVERLQSHYSETLAGGGLHESSTNQMMVEVWASQETGTFTVILTSPEGVACVVATGTDWYQTELAQVATGTRS